VNELLMGDIGVLARGEWSGPTEPPGIAGFVVSTFSPLVAAAAERCLGGYYGLPPGDPDTAVVLASVRGDVTTADAVADALLAGTRVAPLLFFQSNPNAVVGHLTARWELTGPVVCTSPADDPLTDGLAVAELIIADRAATQVLVIAADLATGADDTDHAVAVLVGQTRRT
jgi:hypothetical protein